MEKYLVTGSAKGLGRFLHRQKGGLGLTRANAGECVAAACASGGAEVILHCAWNSAKVVDEPGLLGYYRDNVVLTSRLLSIPHRKFVFISTVDVYAKDGALKREEDAIQVAEGQTPYSFTKLIAESLVRSESPNWLVLRPVQMLGDPGRRNVLARILEGDAEPLPLRADSVLNCILYEDVAAFLEAALSQDLRGTFNLAAIVSVQLGEIAAVFGRTARWGGQFYDIGNISNEKAAAIYPGFRRTTLENIHLYRGATAAAL